jgi:hypothetical protein
MLYVIWPSVVMLSVVMLSVMVPMQEQMILDNICCFVVQEAEAAIFFNVILA